MSNEIGAKLRQLRKSKKWTQEDASARINYTISRSTLSNYEIGRRTPHLNDLRKLATLYGVGLDFFDITEKDEVFELIARARDVFENKYISDFQKEEIYHEFMKLYLNLKSQDNIKDRNNLN